MVAAIKLAKRFVTAQAWQGFIDTPWEPLASAITDEEITKYARNYASRYIKALNRPPLESDIISDAACPTPLEPQRYPNVGLSGAF